MTQFRSITAMLVAVALMSSSATVQADVGDCYRQSCNCKVYPGLLFVGLAVTAIVLGITLTDDDHKHSHN